MKTNPERTPRPGEKPWPHKAPSPSRSWTVYQDNWAKVIVVKDACPSPLCSGDDACGTYATLSWDLTKERQQNKQIMQIKQRASHGPRRPPAKDVTVTANRRPPPSGVTCAPATGRRGSQAYKRANCVLQPRLRPIVSQPPYN